MNVLVVEDHKKINQLLTHFLRQDHHNVKQSYSAEEALELCKVMDFDLIITDLMLPDMQGEELIETIRNISDVYIIVVSAKTEISDRIDALSLGADDYLTKPFSVEEVMIKIRNLEKRIHVNKPLILSFNDKSMVIQPLNQKVFVKGDEVILTTHEFTLLYYLATHRNRIFTREEIIMNAFSDSEAFDRVIDAFVKNIRKKILDDARNPKYIKTVHGMGYQFVGDLDD